MSMMRLLTVAALVTLLQCALVSAQCPSVSTTAAKIYSNASADCGAAQKCNADYCACIGAPAFNNMTCGKPTAFANCTHANDCVGKFIRCTNNATNNCPSLRDLHMSLLTVESGALWNTSVAFQGCTYQACTMLNHSTGSRNCTADLRVACPSTVVFRATLTLTGNFSWLRNNPKALAAIKAAFIADLEKALGYTGVIIVRILINGVEVAIRRQSKDTMAVEFLVEGVSSQNAAFIAKFNSVVASGGSFLTAVAAAFAANGGTGGFVFVGITAGPSVPPVPAPPTAPTPRNNSGTGPVTPRTTPKPSGASMHSFVAAIVLAALSALLF